MAARKGTDKQGGAGRGVVFIAAAKAYFVLTAYAVQLLLPRLLGSAEAFGLFATIISVSAIVNNVLVVSTTQSFSKFISANRDEAPSRMREGLRIQVGIGLTVATCMFLGAPALASGMKDPALVPLLRLLCIVSMGYAIYSAFVGLFNGRQQFARQAGLDMTFSTFRSTGMLLPAFLGLGVLGAIRGFSAAGVLLAIVSVAVVRIGRKPASSSHIPVKTWLAFMAPLWLYHGFLNGILQSDLALLKRSFAVLATEQGHNALDAAALASEQAGYYRAAQTFAFVPYQLIVSLTFVLFPMVSKAVSAGDAELARSHIQSALRTALILVVSLAAPIAGAARGVMSLAYPEEYLAGAGALRLLVLGVVFFSLFVVSATAITSGGRPGVAASIAAGGAILVIILNVIFVRRAGFDGAVLDAASMGTSTGMAVALIAALYVVYLRFRASISWLTAIRVLVAGCVAFFCAALVPNTHPVLAVGALATGFFAYIATLLGLRELKASDLARLLRVRSK